jgi:hypothetical protein
MDARKALVRHLTDKKIAPGTFARSISYDRSNFHKLLNNPDAKPSLGLAVQIERATDGAVPATAWAA